MTQIIDGRKIADQILDKIKKEVEEIKPRPKLVVVQVGQDPASSVYINMKTQACKKVGMDSEVIHISEKEALAAVQAGANKTAAKGNTQASKSSPKEPCPIRRTIKKLNQDPRVTGILVQLPLHQKLDSLSIINSIDPKKDVDCLHAHNVGKLQLGTGPLAPCTPRGCLHLIRSTGVNIKGKNAVVVGQSNIVGRPMARLLLGQGATVTICHRQTRDLKSHTQKADILVVATGSAHLIREGMTKKGAIIIDVGITRAESDPNEPAKCRLMGDVDFENVKKTARAITPVPGGVGPMTVAMLLKNTLICYHLQHSNGQ